MAKLKVTDSWLYRWRFVIGYSAVVIALGLLLLVAGMYIPGGLSSEEIASAITSANLHVSDVWSLGVVDAPYHILQHLSLLVLGVTTFSIKLPSLIIGFFTALGIFFLLRQWFKQNVAIVASALSLTTGQFLFVAQNGAPSIMVIAWPVFLLLFAMLMTRKTNQRFIWMMLYAVTAALSLYTPLSFYVLIALTSAALLHPHLRHALKHLPRIPLVLAVIVTAVIIAPLARTLYSNPSFGLQLLGIPTVWPNLFTNTLLVIKQYFDFSSATSTNIMTPIFSFGAMALIMLGILSIIRAHYTARSYVVAVWTLLLVPLVIINPIYTTITFVPALILLATGFYSLLHEWYRLFPKNPYARLVGLIPLAVLVAGLFVNGVERYVYGYQYNPETASYFSRDLSLIDQTLRQTPGTVMLVTTANEEAFYQTVVNNKKSFSPQTNISVTTEQPTNKPEKSRTDTTVIITHDKWKEANSQAAPEKIIVNANKHNADRFYLYKNGQE